MIAVAVTRCICWTILTLMLSTTEVTKKAIKVNELYHQGQTAYERGDYNAAICACDKTLQLAPKHFASYVGRGHAYRVKHDLERAITDYGEAIRLISEELHSYNGPGFIVTLAKYGRLPYLRQILPDNYFSRACVYGEKRDFEKAIADLNEAIRINPKYVEALYYRGMIYLSQKDYARAIADLEETAHLNPQHYQACFALAELFAQCPQAEFRDHHKALQYAHRGCSTAVWTREGYEIMTRQFTLPLQINSNRRGRIESIRLFVSDDQGKTWKHVEDYTPNDQRINFTAPHDGPFWFALQTVSKDGKSEPSDLDHLVPAMKVYVNSEGRSPKPEKPNEESQREVDQLRKTVEQLEKKIKELQSDRKPK